MKLRGSREAFYAPIEVSAQYERLWEYVLDGGSEVFAFVVRNTFPLPTEIGGLLWFSEDQLKSLRKAQLEGLMNAVREVKEVVKKQEVEIEKLKRRSLRSLVEEE